MEEQSTVKYWILLKDPDEGYLYTGNTYNTRKEAEDYIKVEEKKINAGCCFLEIHKQIYPPRT